MTDQTELFPDAEICAAMFSDCGRYRYRLSRRWDRCKPQLAWVMLNPSLADDERNDRTVNRCIDFAKRWGYGGIVVVNVHAFISPHPEDLASADDPFGPDNDRHLREVLLKSAMVVAAWGAHPGATDAFRSFLVRNPQVDLDGKLVALCVTKEGHPGHPLYLPGSTAPQVWRP